MTYVTYVTYGSFDRWVLLHPLSPLLSGPRRSQGLYP
jgi:hypothetical protein